MVSGKYLIILGFILIGLVLTQTPIIVATATCASGNPNPMVNTDCNYDTTSFPNPGKCCFQSYYVSGSIVRSCVGLNTMTAFTDQFYTLQARATNSNGSNFNLDCASEYISISFMIIALFALIF